MMVITQKWNKQKDKQWKLNEQINDKVKKGKLNLSNKLEIGKQKDEIN